MRKVRLRNEKKNSRDSEGVKMSIIDWLIKWICGEEDD